MDNTKTFIEAPELDFQYSLKLRTHSKFALGDCLFTYYKYKMKLSDEGCIFRRHKFFRNYPFLPFYIIGHIV